MPTVEEIRQALEEVKDPDFDVGIVGMGLIYEVVIDDADRVRVVMTLTSPMCPHAGAHKRDVEQRVRAMNGVRAVDVEITFTPPWDPKTMASDDFKALVGLW